MNVDHEDALKVEQRVLIARTGCVGRHEVSKLENQAVECHTNIGWRHAVLHTETFMLMRLPRNSYVIEKAILHNKLWRLFVGARLFGRQAGHGGSHVQWA
jgi:hypothetical protein